MRPAAVAVAVSGVVGTTVSSAMAAGGTVAEGPLVGAGVGLWVGLPLLLLPLAATTSLAAVLGGGAVSALTVWTGALLTSDDSSTAAIGLFTVPIAVAMGVGGVGIFDRIVQRFAARSAMASLEPAGVGDRLASLALDAGALCVALGLPLQALSRRGEEVAAVVAGVLASTLYFATCVALRGRTLGQWLLGIEVVDADGGGRVPWPRAVLRGLALTIEALGTFLLYLAPLALADVLLASSGRSLLDRLFGTVVQSRSRGRVSGTAPAGS